MGKAGFFPRLALVNLARNRQFYFPYLLTVIGTAAAFYIVSALAGAGDLPELTRYAYLSMFLSIGVFVVVLFAVIFLTYTNGFVMKRRKRELGLYHILGLGKGHIALMLGVETAYTAGVGIVGGILTGMLLQKLVTLLLYQLLHMDAVFGFYVSWEAAGKTALLFGGILLFNLALNLVRMGRQSPVELLREGSVGEREPKTNWLVAVLGVLCLGSGYGIALFTRSAVSALVVYFPAVFLVIIGTYCLFSAVSIVVLKAMRKNKGYYYQASHFINVSGMLYRMRRNATGLANICVLSTMVLVMVSGTLAMYLNSEKTLEKNFPGNVAVQVLFDPLAERPFDPEAMSAAVEEVLADMGHPGQRVYGYESISFQARREADGWSAATRQEAAEVSLNLTTCADYARIVGSTPDTLTPTRFWFPGAEGEGGLETVVNACAVEREGPAVGGAFVSSIPDRWVVVEDAAALRRVSAARQSLISWTAFWNTEEPIEGLEDRIGESPAVSAQQVGEWIRLDVESKENFQTDYYSINGGFFFLGLFLGTLFILAAVLIVYYKQVSEGYEDRERYAIMQKVGMDRKLVRKSVNSQILVVFFAPLLCAAVHVAFDFRLMVWLLSLFGLHEPLVTLGCTAVVFCLFALLYALVYRATARAYYRIVER